jgi:hypothetical protein
VTALGVRVLRTPVRAPRENSVCERFVGTLRRECLGFVIPFHERQLKSIFEIVDDVFQSRPAAQEPWPGHVGARASLPARQHGRLSYSSWGRDPENPSSRRTSPRVFAGIGRSASAKLALRQRSCGLQGRLARLPGCLESPPSRRSSSDGPYRFRRPWSTTSPFFGFGIRPLAVRVRDSSSRRTSFWG